MRARRTAYIVIFVVACLVAGLLYYLQVPRASVVRATADIPAMTQITADMVETIRDETKLLIDQQDVTPLGLAWQAIELQSTEDPLDAALRRVLRAMKV